MINLPKISIITPTFNAEKFIEHCILSVAAQVYPHKEHLIIDGMSTDQTVTIAQKFADQFSHIKIISEKDFGIYDAMNKGIGLSAGEWLYFLGCDDSFINNSILKDIVTTADLDCYDVVYGDVILGDTDIRYDGKFSLLKLMYKNICHQAIIYRKTLLERLGRFDTNYPLLADHVFNMRWFNDESVRRKYIDLVFCRYGVSGDSSTRDDKVFMQDRESLLKMYFPAEYADWFIKNETLTYEVGAGKHTIQVLEDKVQMFETMVDELKRNISHLNQKMGHLKGELSLKERSLADLHNSLSWRITSPLRTVHAKLFGRSADQENASTPTHITVEKGHSSSLGDIRSHIRQLASLKLEQFLNDPNARLTFPSVDSPEISVILVLFNKAEYSYQCLETLLANVGASYEVLIVDNASSDDTDRLLGRLDNVRTIRNIENTGFLKACNQAAAEARGRWLLFLNNDTQVLPSLLTTLHNTAETTELCGAVGAKLIFPDGKLQEAGSIIWSDGSCYGYGRDDDPDKAEYSYLREVDYCSGACLLVRKDLFVSAGSFDERYAPAYYEEVDLCMAVRQQGYRVYYQPAAIVIHYEFGSADRRQDSIDLQIANRRTFVDKWRAQLASHTTPGMISQGIGRYTPVKKRVLVVDDRVPDPALGSGFPRTFELLKSLKKLGYAVAYYPLQIPERVEPVTYFLQQMGIEVLYDFGCNRFASYYKTYRHYFGTVWISRPHNMEIIGKLIKSINSSQTVIYDAEALFAMREITKKELDGETLSNGDKQNIIRQEVELVKYADKIVTVSTRERNLIKTFRADNVHVVSHVCEVSPTERGFDERKDILFVGGFLTSPSPNEDSMLYFSREIFPEVHKQTGARLWIVGTNVLDSIYGLASNEIIVTGRVDDLREYYDKCRVFIAPTRFAAGIPLKLVDALAQGIPAVVTPLIAEQVGFSENEVLIGDGPGDFAAKVVACYSDKNLWDKLRHNSLQMITEEFSKEAFFMSIKSVLADQNELIN